MDMQRLKEYSQIKIKKKMLNNDTKNTNDWKCIIDALNYIFGIFMTRQTIFSVFREIGES